ncbi:MAG: hypothetical protein E8G75_07250 [Sulfitobacter sp. SK025]|nr:MAG: hypothetical protein E8G75_07250 [Sulfitobacter sp. SK025]
MITLGATVAFGYLVEHDSQVQSWWAYVTDAPFISTSASKKPRALRGGNAMEWGEGQASSARSGAGAPTHGRVTHVRDGDTIEVNGRPIRIAALDCAEAGTIAGETATRRMKALVAGERLKCSLTGQRSYDRWIGNCRLASGRDIASVMIAEGLCSRWR